MMSIVIIALLPMFDVINKIVLLALVGSETPLFYFHTKVVTHQKG